MEWQSIDQGELHSGSPFASKDGVEGAATNHGGQRKHGSMLQLRVAADDQVYQLLWKRVCSLVISR